MAEITHRTYPKDKREDERIHHSFIRFDNETGKILSVINSIEYKGDITLPRELIKFYSADNSHNFDAFINNYLWATNPSCFNDPFDCPIQLWKEESFTKENILRIFGEDHLLTKFGEEDSHIILRDVLSATLGVVCLHEYKEASQDILWGYYTNQKGFSVKFDAHQLIKLWGNPFSIEYLEPSILSSFSLDDIDDNKDLFPRLLRWTTQKKKEWEIENEWRFIFNLRAKIQLMDATPENRKQIYPPAAIKEVFLGLRFFDTTNSVESSGNDLFFIADSKKHQNHNQILTFLSNHQEITISHMFFQYDLILHPRKCKVQKIDANRFWINYLE